MKSFPFFLLAAVLIFGKVPAQVQELRTPLVKMSSTVRSTNATQDHEENQRAARRHYQKSQAVAAAGNQVNRQKQRQGQLASKFEKVTDLLKVQPTAVSIELRFDKQQDYNDAVTEYNEQFSTLGITDIKHDGSSYSYALPNLNSPRKYTEFLVINTATQGHLKLKKGTIWYALSSVKTLKEMEIAYKSAISLGIYDSLETPGHGSIGVRDTVKQTYRAILHNKVKSRLIKGNDDGVIINPPIP